MLSKFISILALFLVATGAASANGDIYVTLAGGGAAEIFINGASTGETTPATFRDVTAGDYEVSLEGSCLDVSETVTVVDGRVSRVDLAPSSAGGFMELNVSPDHARVFLDDQPIGVGPYLAMEVACGDHEVRVSALQHQTKTEAFNLSMGQAIRLDISLLQAGTGSISVLVTPVDTVILLDGTRVSIGPITLDSIPSGAHRIGAMLDGFAPIDESIIVATGEVTQIDLTLVADPPPGTQETQARTVDESVTPDITQESITPPLPTEPLPTASVLEWRDYTVAAMVATSLVTGYLSWKTWSDVTIVRYNKYVTENRDIDYYNSQVMPAWSVSIGLAAVSGASLLTGSYFLFYDDNGATSIGLSGRF
jgi:hypothetical protein